MSEEAKGSDAAAAQPHGTKLMIELGPLLAFFAAWFLADIFWATGVLMAATLVSVVASKLLLGRVSPVIIATAVWLSCSAASPSGSATRISSR